MTETRYANNQFEMFLQGGVEAWGGDITYRIGYPVTEANGRKYYGHFPFSELEFPLDAGFGVVKAGAIFGNALVANLQLKTDIYDPDDEMIDRDWISSRNPWRLYIYSESEVTEFQAVVLDGDLSYKVFDWSIMWLAVGGGYMYQSFEYETALIRQWSPSGIPGYDYIGDGSTSLIYEVDIYMPYILLNTKFFVVDRFNVNARLAIAPWMKVEDKDQHLLRDKVNVGDLEGSGVVLAVDAEYEITPQIFVNGGISGTYIDVDGDMDASFGGVYDHTVKEELESNQTALYLMIGFKFGVPAAR
jgi:outer membrane protease